MYSDFVKSIIVKLYELIYNAVLELGKDGVTKAEAVMACKRMLNKKYMYQPFIPKNVWNEFEEFIYNISEEINLSYRGVKIDALSAILETEVGNWGIDTLTPIIFNFPRNTTDTSIQVRESVEDIAKIASYANFEIDEISRWDDEMTSAHYAWEDDVCMQSDMKYCEFMGA